MKRFAALAISAMLVTACAGSGNIDWNNARKLKVGMTEAEITTQLGKPYSVTSKSDGTQVWVWVNVNMMAGTKSLSVIMQGGKAIQVPPIPDSF
jgi:outer membrane protein assembly factor BamE (lipoprotein component of BamABCDE complex)